MSHKTRFSSLMRNALCHVFEINLMASLKWLSIATHYAQKYELSDLR